MSEAQHAPATHDLGGSSRFRCTPIDPDDIPPDAFGKRADAVRQILGQKKLMSTDELRRSVESLSPEEYHGLGYYERWVRAITALMLEKGVIAPEDVR